MAERRRLVLAGGGHAHALVLHRWSRAGRPDVDITLVSKTLQAPYSGMLPGEVAGVYGSGETHIDLLPLCNASQVACVQANVVGIDREGRHLLLEGGSSLRYDILSLNLGSAPRMEAQGACAHAVPVKPIATFRERWLALLDRVLANEQPVAIAIVGAGAAGVELAFAIQARLARERLAGACSAPVQVCLFGAGSSVLPGFPAGVQRAMLSALAARGIEFRPSARVVRVLPGLLQTDSGHEWRADEVVWVTQACAPAWLRDTGLALDAGGFVRVQRTLRSVNDSRLFAAGDVASVDGLALDKAGVVAVRQAPLLAHNLQRVLCGLPMREWRPQRHWLAILSTADGRALATRGGWHVEGRWVWRWKDHLDRRFMRRFVGIA